MRILCAFLMVAVVVGFFAVTAGDALAKPHSNGFYVNDEGDRAFEFRNHSLNDNYDIYEWKKIGGTWYRMDEISDPMRIEGWDSSDWNDIYHGDELTYEMRGKGPGEPDDVIEVRDPNTGINLGDFTYVGTTRYSLP